MQKLLILAALAAVSIGQPVSAQTAPANPSVAVTHRDLDLRTEAGTKALDRRIWRAVVEVCGTAPDFDIAGKNDVRQCRRDTRSVASAQADVVVANASRDQVIQVSSIRK
ncbi:UrcA family protein [Sphingopyxis sp. Root214]|uniref:UrcA family protein n=1 Tax=unclassified Sphingopyxis TaxID=2614943 RepID=UPI0006F8D745|nr:MULTISPECIES: UrcA family protein [unclassified Sphingopyxis]KQZ72621.1 UrcA family protein [Sphingopyxis sp. Root154]KRC06768.1 UrcA family protein [Sphingopyxis sp. Root214]